MGVWSTSSCEQGTQSQRFLALSGGKTNTHKHTVCPYVKGAMHALIKKAIHHTGYIHNDAHR